MHGGARARMREPPREWRHTYREFDSHLIRAFEHSSLRAFSMLPLDARELDGDVLALLDAFDPAVADPHDAVADVEQAVVVRRADDRHAAFLVDFLQDFEHGLPGFEVEVG